MRKYILLQLCFIGFATAVLADIPDGYYTSADGKKYTELKSALCNIIKDHKTFSYSRLWDYYPYTYYVLGNPSQVLDMYSNETTYFSNTTGLNKEHTVPKSWWGGSTAMGPGCDIFNVIPSEKNANSAKSNYPLGEIEGNPTWTNGVTMIGESAINGYSGVVFEPMDSYKGDFARIYFYVATCYPDLAWTSNNAKAMTNSTELTLQSWIIPMLLEWNNNDPVDAAEIQRNEDIYVQQGNRNPFIDYPSLIDYIWGDKTNEEFLFAEHVSHEGGTTEFKTRIPTFSVDYGSEDTPKNIADNSTVIVKGGTVESVLYTRVNEGEWEEAKPTTGWNATTETEYNVAASKSITISGETLVEAYCTLEGFENSDTIRAYYNGVTFDNEYLLYEAFDDVEAGNNTSTSGSTTKWSGNSNFTSTSSAFQAGNAIRLGSSKNTGSLTSKSLTTTGGTLEVELDVKGWSTVEGHLNVNITGAESQTVTYTATMTDAFQHIKLTFNNVSANPILTISTSSKRAFVDNITVKQVEADGIMSTNYDTNHNTESFNLAGQKTGTSHRGITIRGGRKFISR